MQNKCVSIDTPSMTMNQADVGITIPRNDMKTVRCLPWGSSAPQVVRLYDPMLCSSTLRRRDVSMMSKHIVTCLPSGSSVVMWLLMQVQAKWCKVVAAAEVAAVFRAL